jgi:Fe-S cluster biogenesis protein NfuA
MPRTRLRLRSRRIVMPRDRTSPGPDADEVAQRVGSLSKVLDAHAGGLELTACEDDGQVGVRFTGLCAGYPLRRVAFAGLVRPALLELQGVECAHAEGRRMSRHAEVRLTAAGASGGSLLEALACPGVPGARADEQ